MNNVIFLSNLLEQAFSTMDITEIRKPVIWEITRKIEEAIQKSNPHVIHHFDYEERAVVIFALSWCRVRLLISSITHCRWIHHKRNLPPSTAGIYF